MTKKITTTAQAKRWHRRADALFNASVADDDSRGALQSITVGLKALELSAEKEKEQEQEAVVDEGPQPITQQQIDALMARAERFETPEKKLVRHVAWALESIIACSGNPEILNHVEQILRISNSDLLEQFLAYEKRRVIEGDRFDMPAKRGADDEFFSETN